MSKPPNYAPVNTGLSDFATLVKGLTNGKLAKPFNYVFNLYRNDAQDQNISLLCFNATIPGWQILTQPVNIYGLSYAMPTGFAQDTVSLKFYLDENLAAYQYLVELRNMVIDTTSYSVRYRTDYSFSATITMFDNTNRIEDNHRVGVWNLNDCVLTNLGTMNADWSAINTIQTIDIAFAFKEMEFEYLTPSPDPTLPPVGP